MVVDNLIRRDADAGYIIAWRYKYIFKRENSKRNP